VPDPLSCEPSSITAGETVAWTRVSTDYPPGGAYTLRTYLRGAGSLDLTGEASNGAWLFTVTSAASSDLPAGRHDSITYAESGTGTALARYLVDRRTVQVLPNLVIAQKGDRITHAARTLAMIEAVIEGRVTDDVEAYTMPDGRQVTAVALMDLMRLRGIYRAQVAREQGVSTIRTHRGVVGGSYAR
jgi:hypothetical protein